MDSNSDLIELYINEIIETEKRKSIIGTRFETKMRNKFITVIKYVPSATKGTILMKIDPNSLNITESTR